VCNPRNKLGYTRKGEGEEIEKKPVVVNWSRDSGVGIETGYGLYDRGVSARVSVG
jgi:hypothetical protein